MNVLLTKGEPIRNYSNISVIMYLRRKKSVEQMYAAREVWGENTWQKLLCRTPSGAEGGSAPGARAMIALQPTVKTMVRQLSPCSPQRTTGL